MPRHLIYVLLVCLVLTGPLVALGAPIEQDIETPTPAISLLPDSCEVNDTPERACVLSLDQVSGPFTFLPAGDQDYYSVDLGEQLTGQNLEVSVRSTSGLDLRTTMTRAGASTPEIILSSPAISFTLPMTLTGWLILRVENRDPAFPAGQSYSIELRRVLPPPPALSHNSTGIPSVAAPDELENNWNPETAAPIAVGVVYDLTFACPEPWPGACPGGDHDYLRVPVKIGSRYQLAAFDPGAGVDPVIDLFWQNTEHPVASNDDAFAGGFASLVQWTAPANGDLIIRVGPRNGALTPRVPAQRKGGMSSADAAQSGAGGYRFAVVLQQSQLAGQILGRVAQAADVTLPTPGAETISGGNSAASTTAVAATPATDAPTGQAYVHNVNGTALRDAPDAQATQIQLLGVETFVALTGQSNGVWVRVTPQDGVVPGWVYGPDLKMVHAAGPGDGTSNPVSEQPADILSPTAFVPTTNGTPDPTTGLSVPVIQVEALPARPPAPAPTSVPNTNFTVHITIGASAPIRLAKTPAAGGPTPTPVPIRPLAGVRVQLVTAFGDVLTEAITPADGMVTFIRDLRAQHALRLRIPAAGLDIALRPDQERVMIAFPQGDQP